ncbi:hypothetical protein KSP40_PGU010802 [Platanthera guangdongensis]|uniref:CW-type domain-containing protein n=1 Tax=Platanthera guangdongensis TaxID=2320717 RepID=A0ABR2MAW5_9ASPA
MLTVGSRDDGRKRSVLGLEGSRGAGGRNMEEREIEEGEAFSGQDNHIDPDALSYIDEKLQHVLGHFQKEFEAGVSAETLGAKYGGYGSFLPVYQRSPPVTLSQPKSPAKVPGLNLSRSPQNLQPEVGCQNASVIANASITKANTASVAQPFMKYGKRETSISSCSTEGATQHESTRKTLDIRDPKPLKVRIKVGPGNVLIRNKPEIYSDLGLDISPSPSLEDSPDGSRELSPESPCAFVESPSTILQVMTCFPVPGSRFLSPLSETLLHFLEKEDTLVTNIKKNTPQNVVTENFTASDTSLHAKDVRDFTYKEKKPVEKGQKSVKAHGMTSEDVITTCLKNDSGSRSPAAPKVVSSTQDIAVPSSAWCVDTKDEMHLGGNSIKEYGKMFDVHTETNKIPVMEKVQSFDFRKDNYIEFIDSGKVDGAYNSDKECVPLKGKTYSKPHIVEKAFEETNGNFDTATKSKSKSQKHHHKIKSDSDKHRVGKGRSAGFEEHVKEQPAQKVCSSVNKMIQDKDQFMEDEKIIRGSQNETLFNEPNKEKQNTLFSGVRKGIKKLHVKGSQLETKSKISKSPKEVNKRRNIASQSEPLLNAQAQQAENGTHILGPSISTEKSNEKAEVNRVDNFHITGPVTDVTAPLIDSVPKNDVVPALVLIEDNWVCCDICQRWRLLPYGTNPDSLPKKWHCSMQVWLSGLNNCNVSQDETTKVFHELYQFPAPGNDTNVTAHLCAAASSITSGGTPNPSRRSENVMHNAPPNGKKKYGSMDATDLPKDSSLTNLPNSSKNLPASSGNKEFNDVNYCTEMGSSIKPKPGWMSRTTNISGEKHTHKQDKHTAASSFKVGAGDLSERSGQNSKSMSKRGADVDGYKTSKKLKKEGSYHLPKDLHSNFDTFGKMAANGHNEMLAKAPKNILQNYCDYSSKDLKSKSGSSKKSREEHKEISSASEAEKSRKYDFNDKKGKLKERQESKICREISVSSGQITGSRIKLKEALIDGEMRRQNNAKVAKPVGKESRTVIGIGNIDIKGCSTKNSLSRNRKYLPDGIDNVGLRATTDEQVLRSLATTTSSSSKVSGSQKGKVNVPEIRGSPVESVSSSPFKILSTENNSARRNSLIKDNVLSIGYSGMGSPKRYSDGEFDGSSDQSGTRAKDQSSIDCHRASEIYRSAESGVLDSLKGSHDYEDTETRNLTCVKAMDGRHSKIVKHDDVISTDSGKANTVCDSGNLPHHPKKYHLERSDKNLTCDEDERYGSGQKNYGKSSLHSSEKLRSLNFDTDKSKLKGTVTEEKDLHFTRTSNKRHADTEFDNINSSKKINLENHSKQYKAHELRPAISGESRRKPTSQQNPQHASSHERQNSSGLLAAEAVDRSVMDKEKPGKKVWASQTDPEFKKGGNIEKCPVDAQNSEALKSAKLSKKLDEQNGNLSNLSRQPTSSVPVSFSPVKKDGHSVNIFIKEARDLKHTANRLKNLGLEDESCGIFFESALKFLHASYLLEPSNTESTRQGEQVPSPQMLQMYYDTARFCEFCAHEYERLKEMVAAALAYKCAEVAYLKVAYYKHPGASKDRVDLQIALDAPIPGESPSSSASDVDNLNNQGGVDKIASTKAVSSPQVAGNHAIAARNRPHVIRLLTYTNYLNCAFEATKKSHNAIAAASTDLGKSGIDVCSSRNVLDFNFHNVEGLLRLVRLSMNSVDH